MSQLDAKISASVLTTLQKFPGIGKLRVYPNAYRDDVRGELVKGPAVDVSVTASPVVDFDERYFANAQMSETSAGGRPSRKGMVFIAAKGLTTIPELEGEFIEGDRVYKIAGINEFKLSAVVAYGLAVIQ